MSTIEVPPVCLTLLPPWPQAILHAGKRLENRSAGVAAQIGGYRGMIGLSQSKTWKRAHETDACCYIMTNGSISLESRKRFAQNIAETETRTAGKLLLVAELIRIDRPFEAHGNPWHVEGQHGLILDKVWEVEPVPCTGAVGAWKPKWCAKCGHIYANGSRTPNACYTCKTRDPEFGPSTLADRPQLRIVRECVP